MPIFGVVCPGRDVPDGRTEKEPRISTNAPHVGQPLITRFARFDLQDYDPPPGTVADNFRVTMSSASNPAVAAVSNPPSPPDMHVIIVC